MNFSLLVASLFTKKVDMVMSSLIKTEERVKMVDLSDSYMDFNLDVLVRTSDKKGYVPIGDETLSTDNGDFR